MATTLEFAKPHALRNEEEYDAAVAEMNALLDANPEPGSEDDDRLEFLTALVAFYDAEHHAFGEDPVSPQAVVDFILDQHDMTRAELAPLLGGRSRVSDFFNGKRPLSMGQVRTLRERFGIPADLLIDTRTGDAPAHTRFTDRSRVGSRKGTLEKRVGGKMTHSKGSQVKAAAVRGGKKTGGKTARAKKTAGKRTPGST
jgi:HTH-type transcriptional regulator/antitoxin HigA